MCEDGWFADQSHRMAIRCGSAGTCRLSRIDRVQSRATQAALIMQIILSPPSSARQWHAETISGRPPWRPTPASRHRPGNASHRGRRWFQVSLLAKHWTGRRKEASNPLVYLVPRTRFELVLPP